MSQEVQEIIKELSPRVEELNKTFIMDEVDAFIDELYSMAKTRGVDELLDYTQRMKGYVRNFDLINLRRGFRLFEMD